MDSTSLIIFSSLISGMLGVLITNYFFLRQEKRKLKKDILIKLVGSKYDTSHDNFHQAINSIIVVYNEDKEVMQNLKNFMEAVESTTVNKNSHLSQKLLDLIISMNKNLGMKTKNIPENYLMRPLNF